MSSGTGPTRGYRQVTLYQTILLLFFSTMTAYRLPIPKEVFRISNGSVFPSSTIHRSGMNLSGSGYSTGSLCMALYNRFRIWSSVTFNDEKLVNAYQIFGSRIVPAGMKYPLYSSSSAAVCAIAIFRGSEFVLRNERLITTYTKVMLSATCKEWGRPIMCHNQSTDFGQLNCTGTYLIHS